MRTDSKQPSPSLDGPANGVQSCERLTSLKCIAALCGGRALRLLEAYRPKPGTRHSSLPRRSRMIIPNGPWCLPPVNRYATQGSLRACVRLSQLDDVNAL